MLRSMPGAHPPMITPWLNEFPYSGGTFFPRTHRAWQTKWHTLLAGWLGELCALNLRAGRSHSPPAYPITRQTGLPVYLPLPVLLFSPCHPASRHLNQVHPAEEKTLLSSLLAKTIPSCCHRPAPPRDHHHQSSAVRHRGTGGQGGGGMGYIWGCVLHHQNRRFSSSWVPLAWPLHSKWTH